MGLMPPLDAREQRALLVFFGGVLILFAFFAAGAYVGRWPRRGAQEPAAAAGPRPDAELFLVEVGVFDTQEKASDTVKQLRREYISVREVLEPADRLFHVYVGPYPADKADMVANQLRERGAQSVAVKPYARP